MNKSLKVIILLVVLVVVIGGGLLAVFGLPEVPKWNKPVPISWSQDDCEQCGMSIVDRYYTAEITNPVNRKAYKFDDIGCAVVWFKHNHTPKWLKESKIWVTASKTGQWLDARKAYWLKGQRTPMGYGLGAVAKAAQGSLTWEQAVPYLLNKQKGLLQGKMEMGNPGATK